LAAVLTYFAVGVAYMPLVFAEMKKDKTATPQDSTAVATQQGTAVASPAAAPRADVAKSDEKKGGSFFLAMGALVAFAFALPVMAIFSSGAGGILSALIIGIGIRQAWRMSGAPTLAIAGPFRVGGTAPAAAGSA
jgi:hypothetical protein